MPPATQLPDTVLSGAPTVAHIIRRRLALGLLILGLAVVSIVGPGLYAYFDTDRTYRSVLNRAVLLDDLAVQLHDAAIAEVLHAQAFLISGDEWSLASRELAHGRFERAMNALQTQLMALPPSAAAALDDLRVLHRDQDAFSAQAIALKSSGQSAEAARLFDQYSDPLVLRSLEVHRELQTSIQNAAVNASWEYTRRVSQTVLAVVLAFALATLIASLLTIRLLAPTVTAMNEVEHALTAAVENPNHAPAALPASVRAPQVALVQAYSALVGRLRSNEVARVEMMAHVAHDLRSPLAAIAGYAEVMADPEFSPTVEEAQKYLGIISGQAARMERILDQLLTASLIQEDQLTMMPAPLRLGALLEAEVAEASRQSRREIVLDNSMPGAVVLGDALLLRELFGHLLDNSLKFSAPDCPVQAALRAGERPGWLDASITDHGVGIADDDMPRLFQRFGRLHNRNFGRAPGAGLGLFICRHIVEQHGGKIDLISSPGEGTTARVRLPLAAPPA